MTEALSVAWRTIKAHAPHERPYGIVLYEGAEHGYVCVTPFTEEALDRTVAKYRAGQWAEDYEGDPGRESLRWSAPDCPYHVTAEVGCPPLVDGTDQYELWKEWGEDDRPFLQYREAVRGLCFDALAQVDRGGLFGTDRSAMTLVVEDRDGRETDEEIRGIIERLNPPAALERYDRWRSDFEAHMAANQARRSGQQQAEQ